MNAERQTAVVRYAVAFLYVFPLWVFLSFMLYPFIEPLDQTQGKILSNLTVFITLPIYYWIALRIVFSSKPKPDRRIFERVIFRGVVIFLIASCFILIPVAFMRIIEEFDLGIAGVSALFVSIFIITSISLALYKRYTP